MAGMTPRGLGWRPDPKKEAGNRADFVAEDILGSGPAPGSASLERHVLSVLDQGALGSCVANATAQAIRIAHSVQGVKDPVLPSRLWIYWMARATHFDQLHDEGTYGRAACSAIAKLGFCPEDAWPYSDSKDGFPAPYQRMPSTDAFRASFDQRGDTAYHKIASEGAARVEMFKRAISARMPVIFGTDVSREFCQGAVGDTVDPPIYLPRAGGHEMVAVGYEADRFRIVNSWGDGWGDGGFCWFSADYIAWADTRDPWIFSSVPVPVKE